MIMSIRSLPALVKIQAQKYQNKICAIFPEDNEEISYRELFEKSNVIANYLDRNNIPKKSRLLILSPRSKAGYLAYFGAITHGSLVLWADEKLLDDEKEELIKKYRADCLLVHPKHISFAQKVKNSMTQVLIAPIDKAISSGITSKSDRVIEEDDPAICLYTSGSTGSPKGIISTHKNVLWGAKSLEISLELKPKDRLLALTPFSGTNGQIFTIWSVIRTGGSAVYQQGMFTPFTTFNLMDQYKTTWMNATPTHYSIIVASEIQKEEFDISSMDFVRTSSAPLPASVQEKFEAIYYLPMIDSLGMSETAGQLFVNGRKKRKKGSVGKPVMTEYQIRDTQGNVITQPKQEGEIWVRCEGLMPGYLDDIENTNRVIKDSWFDTGDLGYVDEEEFLFLKGRKKDIAIVGGKNVSLREVDECLYAYPTVENAVTIAIPDPIRNQKIIGLVKIKESSKQGQPQSVVQFCHNSLASYKCPEEIYSIDDFPLGGGGKILRNKVRELFLAGEYNGNKLD